MCGISFAVDGTEDGEINCLREGEVAADTRAAIATETTRKASSRNSEEPEDGPFTDEDENEENEDENEENETVIYDC